MHFCPEDPRTQLASTPVAMMQLVRTGTILRDVFGASMRIVPVVTSITMNDGKQTQSLDLDYCLPMIVTDETPVDSNKHAILATTMGEPVSQDINVVALVKGEERYIFLFNDSQKGETLRTLGRYASDSSLSFSWYDAAVLSQKVRKSSKAASTDCPLEQRRAGISSVQDLIPGDEF